MNKKLISMALTGVLAVGMLSVATPSVQMHAKQSLKQVRIFL